MKNNFTGKQILQLIAIESLLAAIVLFLIPTDPQVNGVLGYSYSRLALIVMHVLIAILLWVLPARMLKMLERLPVLQGISLFSKWFFFVGIGLVVIPQLGPPHPLSAYHNRLLPTLIWFTLICLQWYLWALFQQNPASTRKMPGVLVDDLLNPRVESDIPKHPFSAAFRWAGVAMLLAALIPAANTNRVNGIPIDNFYEIAVLVFAAALVFSPTIRRQVARWSDVYAGRIGGAEKVARTMLLLGLTSSVLHIVQFIAGVDTGFFGCYTTPLRQPPRGSCEVFYQNPLQRYGVSRVDNPLYFNESNWNLSFVNDSAFNFYPWKPGKILRERLPFSVTWVGQHSSRQASRIRVEYVGEGWIHLMDQVIDMPPAYVTEESVEFDLPAGDQSIEITYHYDDSYRTGGDPPFAPLPSFLASIEKNDRWSPFSIRSDAQGWQLISLVSDVSILIPTALVALAILPLFNIQMPLIALLTVLALAGWNVQNPDLLILLNVIIFFFYLVRKTPARDFKVALLLFGTSLLWVWFYLPALDRMFLRFAGTDMLTYESFARTILHTFSLRAGEDVFFYQPFYRYLVFIFRLMFGDGDTLRSAVTLSFALFGVWKLAAHVIARMWLQRTVYSRWLVALTVVGTIALFNDRIVWLLVQGVSEGLTWVFLPWMFWLILQEHTPRHAVWMGVLAGISAFTRTNHLPGVIGLLLLYTILGKGWKNSLIPFVMTAGILLLGSFHNLYYGGEFILLPTSVQVNFKITPQDILFHLDNPAVQKVFLEQAKFLFGGVTQEFWIGVTAARVLLVCWIVSALQWLIDARKRTLPALVLIALPWLYLGVQFFFDMTAGYPRQLFAGYLALGCSTLVMNYIFVQAKE